LGKNQAMNKLFVLIFLSIILRSVSAQTVSDIDGNAYPTIVIGTQTWMAKNLASTKASDGSVLTCYPYFGIEDSVKTFGRMYDWENAKKACPSGWHLPSDEEWTALVDFLGGPMIAGGKIKETGYSHWKEPNKGADNKSGFTALPGGYRGPKGKFFNFKNNLAYFWTSTEYDAANAWGYYITYGEPIIYRYGMSFGKNMAFAVRCIQD
jgi:uncharacterized protein (TIGR02145 family)